MWVYNKGHIGQFGNFIFWSQPKTNSELKTWFDMKSNFYGVKKLDWKNSKLTGCENLNCLKNSLGRLFFVSFKICFIKFAVLLVCSNKPNSATQLLKFACNSYPLWFRVFRFYFTKVQYFNCLSRVVDKSSGWLQGEELNWVFFKFWCFAWTLFVFSVFCISCMNVFYRTSPQLIIITNYTILYIKNMQLLRLVIPS